MTRTGRPIINRTRKSLERDIATLRRLRKSIQSDGRIDRETGTTVVIFIDRLITSLEVISVNR